MQFFNDFYRLHISSYFKLLLAARYEEKIVPNRVKGKLTMCASPMFLNYLKKINGNLFLSEFNKLVTFCEKEFISVCQLIMRLNSIYSVDV